MHPCLNVTELVHLIIDLIDPDEGDSDLDHESRHDKQSRCFWLGHANPSQVGSLRCSSPVLRNSDLFSFSFSHKLKELLLDRL